MAVTINADTSNGVIITPDTSGEIALQANGVTKATIGSNGLSSTGHVLQVLQSVFTGTQSTTSSAATDITDLTVTITPSSTSSKILVSLNVMLGLAGGVGTAAGLLAARTLSGTTTSIINPSSAGNRYSSFANIESSISSAMQYVLLPCAFSFLDSPNTTSSVTYKGQFTNVVNGVGVTYINRGGNDGDSTVIPRGVSTITVMEIAG